MEKLEVVMEVYRLHKQGLSQRAISRKLGLHRLTVKRYLDAPGEVLKDRSYRQRGSQLEAYEGHIRHWLEEDESYRATWIYERLQGLGYTGSYAIVQRAVKRLKAARQQVAYMRFETDPGRQAQVDFSEFSVTEADGSKAVYYLFAMILGYSRDQYVELLDRCDLSTFLDCHVRAFAYFGGAPQEILYDRMKNVYLRRLAGKHYFNPALMSLGLHYGFKPQVAPAYAAWVKGKVERPFDFIREGFWRGYGFVNLQVANRDLQAWMAVKRERVHGTTHERVSARFERERPRLQPLPVHAFDTASRLYRTVSKDCTIRIGGNSYVVDHTLVGKKTLARVKDGWLRIFDGDRLIIRYAIPEGTGHLVQDARFYEALRQDATMNERKYRRSLTIVKGRAKQTVSPVKDHFRWDVETRSLDIYESVATAPERRSQ